MMEEEMTVSKNGTVLWVCEPWSRASSSGMVYGDDPTNFPVPLLLLQISLVSSFSAFFQVLLQPFGHFGFVTQMLGGIFLGPSVLGQSKIFISKFFYTRSLFLIKSYEAICFLFISFITTAHVDLGIMKRGGKLAIINGFLLFLLPLITARITAQIILKKIDNVAKTSERGFYSLAGNESTMYFQVAYGVLSNLKMLNSEVGRLALSSMMVCNCFGWASFLISISIKRSLEARNPKSVFWSQISKVLLILCIVFVCRPIMKWMTKRTPEGQTIKQSHLCMICVMLLICVFSAETVGFPFFVGSVVLGLVTPKTQPLGSGLSDKIGCFVWTVLMPCYVIGIGTRVDFSTFSTKDVMILELLFLVIQSAKFVAIVVPSLYFKVPFSHAVILGFIVNIQGLFDVQIYKQNLNYKNITSEAFGIMVISAMVHSTIFTIIVQKLYRSTNKYIAYERRTIQHRQPEAELRILTCFHKREVVPSILNLLELSCPSRGSPLRILALNLEELENHAIPLLIHHRVHKKGSLVSNRRDQIMMAFRNYERQNQGTVNVECFTAVAPYRTMHDDVCSMAFDKGTDLVIVTLDKEDEKQERRMCQYILENAPCSVAVLLDRGRLPDFRSFARKRLRINICAIFLGGADDREMIAYATRMGNHPSVVLDVVRVVNEENFRPMRDLMERKLDMKAINKFRKVNADKQNVNLRDVRIEEACDLMEMLRQDGDDYDLIMVGIRHEEGLQVLEGLSEWSEMKELGEIGDLLASRDLELTASVLAVQQQALVVEEMVESSITDSMKRKH